MRSTSGFGHTPTFTSTPLPYGGAFILATDQKETPSGASGIPPGDKEDRGWGPINEELDLGLEADNEVEGKKEAVKDAGDEPTINPNEVELLKGIIKKTPTGNQPSTVPKSGDKRGSTHPLMVALAHRTRPLRIWMPAEVPGPKKKVATPTKASHPSQWSKEDIDVECQIQYKTDLKCFQTYHTNKIAQLT